MEEKCHGHALHVLISQEQIMIDQLNFFSGFYNIIS